MEKGVIENRGLTGARSMRELVVVMRWRDRPEEILEVFDGVREGVNGLAIFGLLVLEGEGLGELEILKLESGMGLDAGGSKSGGLDIGIRWEYLFLGGASDEKRAVVQEWSRTRDKSGERGQSRDRMSAVGTNPGSTKALRWSWSMSLTGCSWGTFGSSSG